MKKLYSQHIDYCFNNKINGKGLPEAIFHNIYDNAQSITHSIKAAYEKGSMPLLSSLSNDSELNIITETTKFITKNFKYLQVIAIGGSSLNSQIFAQYAYNNNKVKINFMNLIDSTEFDNIISEIDYQNTAFLVISKSGNSTEIISITLALIDVIKSQNANYKFNKHFFFITDNYPSIIRSIAKDLRATIIDHSIMSGRFATLTSSGLLVATIMGLSPKEIRAGAIHTIENNLDEVAKGASLIVGMLGYCYNINVLVTYQKFLSKLNSWYAQMTAESLGKNGRGFTVISTNGVFDQHGTFQLFLEGPQDKFFTFITYNTKNTGYRINCDNKYNFANSKTIGDINHLIQRNTISSIVKRNLPARIFKIYDNNSATIGSLIMHFMLETIVVAKLLKINPFDQPSIEEAKVQLKKILHEHI